MTRAAVYSRISNDPRGTELGVTRQETDCRALCQRKGWEVQGCYRDNDTSAYTGRPRPGYTDMLAALKAGLVDVVVCWHPDRLHRHPRELEDFIDALDAAGATVATVTAGDYDLATPDGRLVARIVGSVARKESEDKSRRLSRKHLELAEAGRQAGGGHRPFGYTADRVTVDPVEADLIRAAAATVLAGGSVRSVAAAWTAGNVATVTGARWSSHTVRRILLSPRIAGLREHRGRIVTVAQWEPIIDPADGARLRAVLTDPARTVNGNPRRYLLTGLAVCGLCGARLVARPKADRRRCYVCATGPGFHGCGRIRCLAGPLEALVASRVLGALDTGVLTAVAPVEMRPLLARIDRLEASMAEAARDFYADRRVTRAQFLAASDAIGARLAAARSEVRRAGRHETRGRLLANPAVVAASWEAGGFDGQRAVLEALVQTVTVTSAVRGLNRFSPDRVSIAWRS